MKYTKYIALLAVLFFTACTTELLEQPSYDRNGTIQLVSRVIPFSDRDVTTRANKSDAETQIKTLDYFIFGSDDKCVFHQTVTSTDPLLIEKSSSVFENLTDCYVVSIANGPDLSVTPGVTTWEDISSQSVAVSGVSIPTSTGLTMIGRYPETGTFNFAELEQGTVLTIPVKSLFSKIVVNISVDSEEIMPGENMPLPTFTLRSVTVNNVALRVDFIGGTESSPNKKDGTDDDTIVSMSGYSVDVYGETSDGGAPLSFSFYLPERFMRPFKSAEEFLYPFGQGESISSEAMVYRQRYKPLLAKGYTAYNSDYVEDNDKNATFVTLEGVYSNHQGHKYDVSYDLYVGNDNYGNFDIVRNNQYNNNVTIKGINNSNNQSGDLGSVSIDHRVDIQRTAPIIVNLRRETLLDSHFEVRPMLIRKNEFFTSEISENAKVKIQVVYDDNETPNKGFNWVGLEPSFGDGKKLTASDTYLVYNDLDDAKKNAEGKRKYFTTDLTTVTLASTGVFDRLTGLSIAGGTTVVIPITDEDQRVWIYIDECTKTGNDVRSARILVSYSIDGTNYSEPIQYVLNQRLMYPIIYNNKTYNIEYHEEYLYNYDSDDQYGQTDYEGFPWGLNGAQLSFDELSLEFGSGLADYFTGDLKPYYDFYVKKHDSAATGRLWEYNGYDFMTNIIKDVNVKNNPNRQTGIDEVIDILDLSTDPSSAIEYCLNKNKRNSDGHVIWQNEDGTWNTDNLKWYLPAIDEIEDIVMGGYSEFLVFQNNYYWSCQPSYIRNYAYYNGPITSIWGGGAKHGPYYIDDINYARATKVTYLGNDNYSYVSSGVEADNYYNAWYHYELGIFEIDDIIKTGNWDYGINTTLGTIKREPGNHPRTKKNRIRCVYYTEAEQN